MSSDDILKYSHIFEQAVGNKAKEDLKNISIDLTLYRIIVATSRAANKMIYLDKLESILNKSVLSLSTTVSNGVHEDGGNAGTDGKHADDGDNTERNSKSDDRNNKNDDRKRKVSMRRRFVVSSLKESNSLNLVAEPTINPETVARDNEINFNWLVFNDEDNVNDDIHHDGSLNEENGNKKASSYKSEIFLSRKPSGMFVLSELGDESIPLDQESIKLDINSNILEQPRLEDLTVELYEKELDEVSPSKQQQRFSFLRQKIEGKSEEISFLPPSAEANPVTQPRRRPSVKLNKLTYDRMRVQDYVKHVDGSIDYNSGNVLMFRGPPLPLRRSFYQQNLTSTTRSLRSLSDVTPLKENTPTRKLYRRSKTSSIGDLTENTRGFGRSDFTASSKGNLPTRKLSNGVDLTGTKFRSRKISAPAITPQWRI